MATQTQTATEVFELQPTSKTTTITPIYHPPRSSHEVSNYDHRISDTESSATPSVIKPSTLRTFLTIFTPSFVGFIASFTNGIITVGLPSIARSIALERSLYLWPSSVYGLTSGAALLIAGSVADIVGARPVELTGITFLGVFTLACGFAQTGGQLVAFRALQGVALAIISADLTSIRSAKTASLLAISILLLCAFPAWMHYRERRGKTALVPNKLWNSLPFTSTCIMVALSYGVMNSIELFSSLYFQEVQHASMLATSLYLLPNLLAGVLIQISVGLFVHRVPARWLVAGSALICAISPLLMAVVPPTWSYWKLAFWAQMFAPFSADVLFTVGLIIVSDNFPEKTQALAGAVFNTVAQFGMSLGMGSCQVVALGVQVKSGSEGTGGHGDGDGGGAFEDQDDVAVLKGYRASYWLMFGYMVVCMMIAVVGLRKAGKVGLKRE
ncbi:uncharacterized protein J4E88_004935 [Alternaria novae-zelandiae]|uniref:uncharacterized protein n=1 Tax=Alternaria novae-zelandiae TaxID=430562 RepID=UPI0020C2008B|nr:uncharacterized protein J4E88_004935 [Alternaria novae-zelandiae]KAI4682047.1 hypothetical protein J4E88_004935 [Alternaria novae-zelandiae]